MNLKYKLFILFFLMIIPSANCQNRIRVGANLGGGFLNYSSLYIGAAYTGLLVDAPVGENTYLRGSFIYNFDYGGLLPDKTNPYVPFIKGLSGKILIKPDIANNLFLEQGIGLCMLNDRMYSDRNRWDYGISFSLGLAKYLSDNVDISLSAEYNLTLTGSAVKTFNIYFSLGYIL